MTIAAETSKNAHNRPEMCGPVSKKERKLIRGDLTELYILSTPTFIPQFQLSPFIKLSFRLDIKQLCQSDVKKSH